MIEQGVFQFEERRIFTVAELVDEVRLKLESSFRGVWLQGEISNLKRPASGHLYFTLKDDEAQLSAVCFRMQSRYLRFEPEDGMDVIVRGSITVYPPRGQLQMMVEQMEPVGRGSLQVAFEQLKLRLQAEGLFDPARKRKLPLLPSRVGIVTSASGAAIQDILKVLGRRNDRVSILLYPTRVQGREAAGEIAAGIDFLSQRDDIDVIIVGRGGGSLEDLWPFNEEIVARAIFRSSKPVISAVGHEIDFTISDFVADLRAPTPSAAAEIVCGQRSELENRIRSLASTAAHAVRVELSRHRRRYERLVGSRGFVNAETRVRFLLQRLDELRVRLSGAVDPLLQNRLRKLNEAGLRLEHGMQLFLRAKTSRVETIAEKLKAFSPLKVLERGYAIVSDSQGHVIRNPGSVRPKELIHVHVQYGQFRARKED